MALISLTFELDPNDMQKLKRANRSLLAYLRTTFLDRAELLAANMFSRLVDLTPGVRLPHGWDFKARRRRDSTEIDITHDEARTKEGIDRLLAIEFGARPHPIFPRRASVLAFEKEGEVKFRPMVNHPGNRAFGMIRKSFAEGAAASRRLLLRTANDAARIWGES